jgi:DNA-binding NtrC family response regulator
MSITSEKHILIAEDEEGLLNSMQFLFHRKGYWVSKAKSGSEAYEIFLLCSREQSPIDLLITDVQMPGMDGEILIQNIRRLDPRMPILAMTGFGHKEMVIRLMRLGCNDFIDKPFTMDQIEHRVESLLSPASHGTADM